MGLDEQPPTDKSNLGGENKEMKMKKILTIGWTAALLLNNEILSLAIINIASIWAVFLIFREMSERWERF